MPYRSVSLLLFIFVGFGLSACREYKPLETDESFCTRICIQKMESTELGLKLRHPDGWSHATQPGLITIFYHGIKDSRQIVKSFLYIIDEHQMDDDDLLSSYKKNLDYRISEIKKQYSDSVTINVIPAVGKEFANRKWEMLAITYSIAVQGKKMNFIESYYLNSDSPRSLAIKVTEESDSDLSLINSEIDCILSKIEFLE